MDNIKKFRLCEADKRGGLMVAGNMNQSPKIMSAQMQSMQTKSSKNPKDEFLCIGVGSRQYAKSSDDSHVLFLDLDGHSKSQAEVVAKNLINTIACSDCYIVQSSEGNHHLICFDLFPFNEVKKIASIYAHKQWAKFRGDSKDFVLRVCPKMKIINDDQKKMVSVEGTEPRLVSVVTSPYRYRKRSNSLRKFFQQLWNYKIPKDNSFNDDNKIRFHCYRVRLLFDNKEVENIE